MKTNITFLIALTICFCAFSNTLFAQGEFRLLSKHKKSDINYVNLKHINQFIPDYDTIIDAFQPVKGQYIVYLFVKEFLGESIEFMDSEHPDTLVPFHDLIVLKTNSDQLILDAFYYRAEWAEPPNQFMLFRASADAIYLEDQLPIPKLCFLNEYEFFSPDLWEGMYDLDEHGRRILSDLEKDILKF